jgi:hypothetical protein
MTGGNLGDMTREQWSGLDEKKMLSELGRIRDFIQI